MKIEFKNNTDNTDNTNNYESNLIVSNIVFNNESAIFCKVGENGDNLGIYRTIHLPKPTSYLLEVKGLANNNFSYISVLDMNDNFLCEEKICLTKDKMTKISVVFNSFKEIVKIGIKIGKDMDIVETGNYFILADVVLSYNNRNEDLDEDINRMNIKNNEHDKYRQTYNNDLDKDIGSDLNNSVCSYKNLNGSSNQNYGGSNNQNYGNSSNNKIYENGLLITRVFKNFEELSMENDKTIDEKNPKMKVGEYAILKNVSKDGIGLDDLYIMGRNGLEYVSRIGNGLPSFIGDFGLNLPPGRVLPIYREREEALRKLEEDPNNFYKPKTELVYDSMSSSISSNIYLYLDPLGYVRWVKK